MSNHHKNPTKVYNYLQQLTYYSLGLYITWIHPTARNFIVNLEWIYYGPKGIFWILGKYSYFGLLYSYVLLRDGV